MRIHDCVQGTTEWRQLRAGIPTSSEFSRIVTPTGKPSVSAEAYLFELLAERITGHPAIQFMSEWMSRGNSMESDAVSFYEFQRDFETTAVGFITNDAGTVGASPDRLVGETGLLEVKCPKESTHMSYLLKKAVDQAYYPQVQGQLWVSERSWVDILSFHPELPPALVRVERDEKFIKLLEVEVTKFSQELEAQAEIAKAKGWIVNGSLPRGSVD